MLGRNPIADICHLLTSAPVDIDRVARHGGPAPVEPPPAHVSFAEHRYRMALALARRRLIADSNVRAGTDQYMIDLINHHARSILMPRHLVAAAARDGLSAEQLAEMFQVPADAAERRLRDFDLRKMPAKPDQNASR